MTFEKVLPGILAFFSIAFSVVLPSWAAIIAGSTWVGLLLFAGIVICLIYHQTEWGKTLPYVLVPLWLISCISCGRTYMENRKVHAREPLADATESLVESIVRSHNSPHWVIETLDGGNLVCFLVDADYLQRHERFVWDASDPAKYAALLGDSTETGWEFRVELIKVEYKDIQASSKSVVGYADRRILKDGWDREGVELLPESTLLTIRGARHMETFNWEKSRSLFEESSRLENPAGTYYLAKWYGTGCGTEADPDEYRRKLEEAARNGSRLARYEWANGVLSYGSASPVEKAKAVDFLKSAYSLKTVATLTTVLTSQRSVQLLSRYYQKTGQGIRAFLATRSYLKAFDNPHIRYHDHLVNTLTLGLSRRALKAVREGETLGIPNCYYIHGMMYAQGIGEKENRREAEKYLRYAGDELHYREAYLGLAMLSDKRKAKRASDFWRMMYDVNFSDTIAE